LRSDYWITGREGKRGARGVRLMLKNLVSMAEANCVAFQEWYSFEQKAGEVFVLLRRSETSLCFVSVYPAGGGIFVYYMGHWYSALYTMVIFGGTCCHLIFYDHYTSIIHF